MQKHFREVPVNVRKNALETIEKLSYSLDLTDYASRIIHPLIRTIDRTPELRKTAMDTLSAMVSFAPLSTNYIS